MDVAFDAVDADVVVLDDGEKGVRKLGFGCSAIAKTVSSEAEVELLDNPGHRVSLSSS